MITEPADSIDIVHLLENIAGEANRLAGVASELDGLMADIAVSEFGIATDQLVRLQSIDALRQALEAIAQVTRSAAQALPADSAIGLSRRKLADGVTLQEVREACLGLHNAQIPLLDDVRQGAIIFDDG